MMLGITYMLNELLACEHKMLKRKVQGKVQKPFGEGRV
jgi:hypothetical protein